ncbi:MAG: hypothetical protein Q9200_001419 [Gallowayella weberi]
MKNGMSLPTFPRAQTLSGIGQAQTHDAAMHYNEQRLHLAVSLHPCRCRPFKFYRHCIKIEVASLPTAKSVVADPDFHSQANISSPGVPAAFKVELVPDLNKPIHSEEIYRTATDMMFVVTDHPITQTWFDTEWKSPVGESGISIRHKGYGKDPSRLSTQFIIWGLNHILLSMTVLENRYCETTALLKWNGNPVGSIHVSRQLPAGKAWNLTSSNALAEYGQRAPGSLNFTTIDIRIQFGDKAIPKKLLYLTTIKAMGEACERGLSAHIPDIATVGLQQVTWRLIPWLGHSGIEAGYSRLAAIKTLASMVLEREFKEAVVWVKADGIAAAFGGFTQGDVLPPGETS